MAFNPCPSFYSRLSCTPPSFNYGPTNLGPCCNNQYSGCSLLPPPSFSPSSCTPEPSSGKLARFANGNGDLCNEDRAPCRESQPRRDFAPLKPRYTGSLVPPQFIDSGRERAHGRMPAERLRNVDVQEELCYFVPGGSQSNNEGDAYCCCSVCNCCGAPEYVPCECPGRDNKSSAKQNPVKYSRRQRFTFEENEVKMNNFEKGPIWPFEAPRASNRRELNMEESCNVFNKKYTADIYLYRNTYIQFDESRYFNFQGSKT